MEKISNFCWNLPEIILARFPFISAFTLLMILAERDEKYPPIPPRLIYSHIAIFLAVGFLMSAKVKRKELSLVYAGQLLYFAYNTYTNQNLRYTEPQRIRMSVRLIGCAGIYVLFSYFQEQVKSRQLRKLGETLVGIFLIAYVYIINNTYEDKRAFLMHIPGGNWIRYFITLALACGAISFFSGYFLRDVSISLAIVFAILTVAVDCDIQYWVNKRGMFYWNQVRVIADDLCIIIGFCLLMTRGDNKIKVD